MSYIKRTKTFVSVRSRYAERTTPTHRLRRRSPLKGGPEFSNAKHGYSGPPNPQSEDSAVTEENLAWVFRLPIVSPQCSTKICFFRLASVRRSIKSTRRLRYRTAYVAAGRRGQGRRSHP